MTKDDVVKLIEQVIKDIDGNPKILMEKIDLVPQVIPIKFDIKDFAELFVRQHAGRDTGFPNRFDDAAFKTNWHIIEDNDGSQIDIGNIDKKVFNLHGYDLQFITSFLYCKIIQWEAGIDETIKARYTELMISR